MATAIRTKEETIPIIVAKSISEPLNQRKRKTRAVIRQPTENLIQARSMPAPMAFTIKGGL
jgi:hypothetical protein